MNDKLKILKDFVPCDNYPCCFNKHAKELRQSAIDWINKLESIDSYSMEFIEFQDSCAGEYASETFGNVTNWIMHFFNITEDDLK